jgi:pimeloyl-ACP methyl ester carboxylesterase
MNARRFAVLFVVMLWLVVIAFGHIADRLILWPTKHVEDAHGATRFTVPLGTGQLEVFRATSTSPSTPTSTSTPAEAFVLRFYGNADRAERWVAAEAAQWRDRPIELWGVNYPGYGRSTGPARLEAIGDAALAAYDALRAAAGNRPIYVFGTSLGTTAALHVAAEREVAGLVLQNPPALRQLIVGEHGWWNLWLLALPVSLQIPHTLDSVANAARTHCPAVFLLADRDEVVPHKYHRLVADSFAGPKEVLIQEGAEHNTPMSVDFAQRAHAAIARLMR